MSYEYRCYLQELVLPLFPFLPWMRSKCRYNSMDLLLLISVSAECLERWYQLPHIRCHGSASTVAMFIDSTKHNLCCSLLGSTRKAKRASVIKMCIGEYHKGYCSGHNFGYHCTSASMQCEILISSQLLTLMWGVSQLTHLPKRWLYICPICHISQYIVTSRKLSSSLNSRQDLRYGSSPMNMQMIEEICTWIKLLP